jgi:hypothetical protein
VSARPSQHPLTLAELDALPVRIDIPTAARLLGTGPKKLRALFRENGGRTARVQVGDEVVVVAGIKLGRQLWVQTESLKQVFQARAP